MTEIDKPDSVRYFELLIGALQDRSLTAEEEQQLGRVAHTMGRAIAQIDLEAAHYFARVGTQKVVEEFIADKLHSGELVDLGNGRYQRSNQQ